MKIQMFLLTLAFCCTTAALAGVSFEKDTIKISSGSLEVTFIGHGSLMLKSADKIIYVDPYSKLADYSTLPKADMIFITHEHQDHLDLEALNKIRTPKTKIILTQKCAEKLTGGIVMKNGDALVVAGIDVAAVPAYNIVHKRDNGQPFHPKGDGNGYVLTFGGTRLYIAGDTEKIPEMKALKQIDYAFLPMNLPYTMTPEMVADAAKAFNPKVLYPYHYGETDPNHLVTLLKDAPGIEVRIRKMH